MLISSSTEYSVLIIILILIIHHQQRVVLRRIIYMLISHLKKYHNYGLPDQNGDTLPSSIHQMSGRQILKIE